MWQFVLNQKGIACLEFNTYIISVLVIFFLQVDHGFPTVDQILGQDSSIDSKASYFKPILGQFFAFYGHRYQMQNHVISAHIGRWQERQMQSEQKNFSTAQQRFVLFENNLAMKNLIFYYTKYMLNSSTVCGKEWKNRQTNGINTVQCAYKIWFDLI